MTFNKIKVCIVEDSEFYRAYLSRLLTQDSAFQICGQAATGTAALPIIAEQRPDVIVMDLHLPDVNKFELLNKVVAYFDIPIIVVSSLEEESIHALELGASDFLPKVSTDNATELKNFATMLQIKLKVLAGVHTRTSRNDLDKIKAKVKGAATYPDVYLTDKSPFNTEGKPSKKLIAIGASLGGVEATLLLLESLPETLPGIIVVQHMPPGFTKAYAQRLNKNTKFRVREATSGDVVEDGLVLVASGGNQLRIKRTAKGFVVQESLEAPVNGFCPSVDVVFHSVAKEAGKDALGIILTGIGSDGAQGMKAMHDAGAHTLGQNKQSCAVYGMPQAAMKLGAIDIEGNIAEISKDVATYFAQYIKGKRIGEGI